MTNTPSDEELDSVLCHHWPAFSMQAVLVRMWLRDAMRAALAKWGKPQPVVREPLGNKELQAISLEYSDSEDECTGFRDGWRFAEKHYGITQRGGSHHRSHSKAERAQERIMSSRDKRAPIPDFDEHQPASSGLSFWRTP